VASLSEERLSQDLTRAMKARDMPRVYVLRGLLTSVKNLKVEKRAAVLGEAELIQLVRREIRKRDEAEEFARKADRQDAVEQNRAERAMLEEYAPPQVDAARLEEAVRELAARPDGRAMGAIMSALREKFAGNFDGKQASEIVRRVLAESAAS
jgi:uncharacterized protein YqeY